MKSERSNVQETEICRLQSKQNIEGRGGGEVEEVKAKWRVSIRRILRDATFHHYYRGAFRGQWRTLQETRRPLHRQSRFAPGIKNRSRHLARFLPIALHVAQFSNK